MSKSLMFLIVVVVAVAAFYFGYWYGDNSGYDRGLTDAAQIQSGEADVQIDTGYKNPYEEVNLNPFK